MSLNLQDVELNEVDTSKGYGGIFVQSVVESRKGENLFMTIILEQNVDEEHIRTLSCKCWPVRHDWQLAWAEIERSNSFGNGSRRPKVTAL